MTDFPPIPPTPAPTAVDIVEIIWAPARKVGDDIVPSKVELTAYDRHGVMVILSDPQRAALLDAFHDATMPAAKAAVQGYAMTSRLLEHLLDRMAVDDLGDEPLVDESWLAAAKAIVGR